MRTIPHPEQHWRESLDVAIPEDLASSVAASEFVLKTLVRRGITQPRQAQAFLDYHQYQQTPATDLPDLEKGVERIIRSIHSGHTIGVWGDFDVDGQTSTALLVSVLAKCGAQIKFHIPVRATESHGIKIPFLKDFIARGVDVLLTCDTGVSAIDEIDYAQSIGVDVIITDHHILPDQLPPAHAVINPRRLPAGHPLATLPGVGTAYKFAEHLLNRMGFSDFAPTLHDLVALGCIADLADLTGDTRFLVQSGLALIRNNPRPALRELFQSAEIALDRISEEHISFVIAPRLNAIGRLGDANPIVPFLLSDDPAQINVVVNQLEGLNAQRRVLCNQVFQGALSQIDQDRSLLEQPALVLSHPAWSAGVAGIAASRLVGMFHRPVILLVAPDGEPAKGSARSVPGVDITAAIAAQREKLLSFGGHPMAAGLSILPDQLASFKRDLFRTIQEMNTSNPIVQELVIDASISLPELTLDFVHELNSLSPFGPGNPPIIFSARDLKLDDAIPVGKTGEHLQMVVEDKNGKSFNLIWWQGAGMPQPASEFDLAFTAHSSNYKGEEQVQLEWVDYREKESIQIDNESSRKLIEFVDLRSSEAPQKTVSKLVTDSEFWIFKEGSDSYQIAGSDRSSIRPASTLVFWSQPPDIKTLHVILDSVKPQRVIWLLIPSREQNLAVFIKHLPKLIREEAKNSPCDISINHYAASLNATPEIIRAGVSWLGSKGFLTVIETSQQDILKVSLGGLGDKSQSIHWENILTNSFAERSSFSNYLQRVDLGTLISKIG